MNINDLRAFENLDGELMALAKQYDVDVVDQEQQVSLSSFPLITAILSIK